MISSLTGQSYDKSNDGHSGLWPLAVKGNPLMGGGFRMAEYPFLVEFSAVVFHRRQLLQRLRNAIGYHATHLLLHHKPLLRYIGIRIGHGADIIHLDEVDTRITRDTRRDRLTNQALVERCANDLAFLTRSSAKRAPDKQHAIGMLYRRTGCRSGCIQRRGVANFLDDLFCLFLVPEDRLDLVPGLGRAHRSFLIDLREKRHYIFVAHGEGFGNIPERSVVSPANQLPVGPQSGDIGLGGCDIRTQQFLKMVFRYVVVEGLGVTAFSGELAGKTGGVLIRLGARLDLLADVGDLIGRLEILLIENFYIVVTNRCLDDLFLTFFRVETKIGEFLDHSVICAISEIATFRFAATVVRHFQGYAIPVPSMFHNIGYAVDQFFCNAVFANRLMCLGVDRSHKNMPGPDGIREGLFIDHLGDHIISGVQIGTVHSTFGFGENGVLERYLDAALTDIAVEIRRLGTHAAQIAFDIISRSKLFLHTVELLTQLQAVARTWGSVEGHVGDAPAFFLLEAIFMRVDILLDLCVGDLHGAVRDSKIRGIDIGDRGQLTVVGIHFFDHPFGNIGAVRKQGGVFFAQPHFDELRQRFFEKPPCSFILSVVGVLLRTCLIDITELVDLCRSSLRIEDAGLGIGKGLLYILDRIWTHQHIVDLPVADIQPEISIVAAEYGVF